jgi:hypothetical protein
MAAQARAGQARVDDGFRERAQDDPTSSERRAVARLSRAIAWFVVATLVLTLVATLVLDGVA